MRDLTSGNEGKLILAFAMPMVIGNVLQQAYSIVDSMIVGRVLGKEALAAVGASFPVIYTLIAFVIGIGSGATVVVSQYFGAKQFEEVKRATSTIFIFLFGASILITILGIVYAEQIFIWLKIELHVLPLAKEYFVIYMLGTVAFFGFNGISSVLRGMGDSMTPLYFMLISTVLNIGLDLLFVMVFHWGIAGVAWATLVAQLFTFIVGAVYLTHKHQLISFRIKDLIFDKKLFVQSLKIGLPTGFQQTFVALGMTALIRIVNNFDTSVLAAYTIASRIDALAGMPALSLSSALSAFVGQNMGANRTDRVRKGFRATLYMAWTISILVMVVVYFFGESIVMSFNRDAAVVEYGTKYLVVVSSFYLFFSTMFVIHGVLRGAGDTLIPMFISLISLWIIRIPFAVFLSAKFGVVGIWWSIPCGWVMGWGLSHLYFLMGRWKKKVVVR